MKNESKKTATAKNETVVAKQADKAENKPQGDAKPQATETVKALWEKAVAAKNAAAQGLLDQAVADELWAKAEEASKPTPEALERNEKAKIALKAARKTAEAAKVAIACGLEIKRGDLKAAQDALAKAETEAKDAAQAAKGFGPGAGGRCKGQMSGIDAAFQVLASSDNPMRVKEMADAAIEQGLWAPEGQTPAMTLSAAIQRELKKGDASRFIKTEAGLFTARKNA